MIGTESAASMEDADYRIVAKHLGHRTATQQRYYEVATCNSALKAHKKLEQLAEKRWRHNKITINLAINQKDPFTNKGLCIHAEAA